MDNLKVLNDQLIRMRQMNRYYHQQFLTDVRLIMIITISMLVFVNELTFYILPFVSLFGAVLLSNVIVTPFIKDGATTEELFEYISKMIPPIIAKKK